MTKVTLYKSIKFKSLFIKSLTLVLFFIVLVNTVFTQSLSNYREYKIYIASDTITLDTLSIIPDIFAVYQNNTRVENDRYELLWSEAKLVWKDDFPQDSLLLKYRVFNLYFHQTFQHKDPNLVIPKPNSDFTPYVFQLNDDNQEVYYSGNLSKSGSITRGIAFGNNQDLSITSGLDLQLNGYLNDDIQVLASITDNNIPIQPDGNTQQLQDFDKVFIQLFTNKSKLIAGDFDLTKPRGYFMKYNKKAQGLYFQTGSNFLSDKNKDGFKVNASAAISKGKFVRNSFPAIEGNQGPYKLRGNENEPFIIVLSGSEKVYIDGKLMIRGTNNDYTINYNSAEVIFTSKQPLTKDKRIVVEFQYSDKNYVRSLVAGGFEQKKEKLDWFVQVYSEQDSKNQPLQQDLTNEDKFNLSRAGDDFLSAFVFGADSIGYSNDFVLYALIDSLGTDSVFLFSNHPDSAHYRVIFSQVGLGNGDYVESGFEAGGKVYRWIAPELIDGELIRQGNYAPLRLLKAPVKQQMVSAGGKYYISKNIIFSLESSLSNVDKNTFSGLDDSNNLGFGVKTNLKGKKPVFSKDKAWVLEGNLGYEKTDVNFSAIERFRGIEFQRDWNLGARKLLATTFYHASVGLKNKNNKIIASVSQFDLPKYNELDSYQGQKAVFDADIKSDKWGLITSNSFLKSKEGFSTQFLRSKADVFTSRNKIKLGVKSDLEDNQFFKSDSLFTNSHQFYFGEVYVQNSDSTTNGFRFFYNQRLDRNSDSLIFENSALAKQYGATLDLKKNPRNRLKITVSNRSLEVLDGTLLDVQPEETLLGRIDHTIRSKKAAVSLTSYYELSSGLEPQQEFIYIEVPAGQGVYVWNDYNGNNIKELNEFEIAAFSYEANYLRSFIPSDNYRKVFGNFYSQILQLNPIKIWANEKGIKKQLAHFSTLTAYRTERKTSFEDKAKRFNPFLDQVADTSLVALTKSFRNTIYFNRTNSVFGIDYSYLENKNKALLTNGFEARSLIKHEVKFRLNLSKGFSLKIANAKEEKINSSDFLSARSYHIISYRTNPELLWQPNNKGSIKWLVKYGQKINEREGNTILEEKAIITDFGIEGRLNSVGKGVVQLNFNWIDISYNGLINNNLAFEMLEGLKIGTNFTWGLNFQRKIAKNIQFNLNYEGRKSDGNTIVHAGGMSAKAFF